MSYQRSQRGPDLRDSALLGAGAYIVGFLVSIVAVETELLDQLTAVKEILGFEGYFLAQLQFHELNMLTGGDLRTEYIPMTVVMIALMVGAGYLAASRADGGLQAGGAIVAGYFPMVVLATVVLFVRIDGLELTEPLIRLVAVGIVDPLVFGAIGGVVAENTG